MNEIYKVKNNLTGLLIAIGLIALASARPQDYTEEYLANGERVCRLNCGRPFNSGCPIIPCPRPDPPVIDQSCPIPSCLDANADWLLWPVATNEAQFYQCLGRGVWQPIARDCSCATLFDYRTQKCVHPHEWNRQCTRHPATPRPKDCPVCPGCGEGEPTTQNPTWPTNPTTWPTNPTTWPTTSGPNNCPCICAPCIIWPCSPCPQNCPCARPYNEETNDE